jgi:uncharacterized protein YndB with AHSA1/START domain
MTIAAAPQANPRGESMTAPIAPITRTVQVKAPPARAFELFTAQMGRWWGKGIGKQPHVDVIVEARVGGRWFERDADGNETQWGKVLAWEPPSRLLLAWQITSEWRYDPALLTELELTFTLAAGGGTLVTLEHRNLERFGKDAPRHVERIGGGWPMKLGAFAAYADTGATVEPGSPCPTSST